MSQATNQKSSQTAVELWGGSRISDDELASLTDMASVQSVLGGTELIDVADYGTGFSILDNKDRLVGVPFLVLEFQVNDGNFGPFVSCVVVTFREGTEEIADKWIVNDGSTGMCQQLISIAERAGQRKGILVRSGLRRSDFDYSPSLGRAVKSKDEVSDAIPAKVYYLDLAA